MKRTESKNNITASPLQTLFSQELCSSINDKFSFYGLSSLVVYSFFMLSIHASELISLKTTLGERGLDYENSPWLVLKIMQMKIEWDGFVKLDDKPSDDGFLSTQGLVKAFDLPAQYATLSRVCISFHLLVNPDVQKPKDPIQILRAERLSSHLQYLLVPSVSKDDLNNISYQLMDFCSSSIHCQEYESMVSTHHNGQMHSQNDQVFFTLGGHSDSEQKGSSKPHATFK